MSRRLSSFLIVALLVAASPAVAQSIDTSAIDSVMQSILDAMTGTTGRLIMTVVAVAILIAGALNYIDWSRVFQLLIIIVVIGVAPTVVQSIWGTT
ncbi:TrbC/VirB2 family protein [Gymnodinialimonas sp. 2305UL16-5]|uniref:TrbC/VirB2 family protein n=1 Tax=Gymnodinialimonas mytili TaxID=3126503 RepID=UPI00309B8A5B